jgi:hypothetical protein
MGFVEICTLTLYLLLHRLTLSLLVSKPYLGHPFLASQKNHKIGKTTISINLHSRKAFIIVAYQGTLFTLRIINFGYKSLGSIKPPYFINMVSN